VIGTYAGNECYPPSADAESYTIVMNVYSALLFLPSTTRNTAGTFPLPLSHCSQAVCATVAPSGANTGQPTPPYGTPRLASTTTNHLFAARALYARCCCQVKRQDFLVDTIVASQLLFIDY